MAETHAQSRPSRRRVPRWVWFVVVCLALGLLTSVGVSWLWAARYSLDSMTFVPLARYPLRHDGIDGKSRLRLYRAEARGVRVHCFEAHSAHRIWADKLTDSRDDFERLASDASSQTALHRHAVLLDGPEHLRVRFYTQLSGWPFLCLGCEDAFTGDEASVILGRTNPLYGVLNGTPPRSPTHDAIPITDGLLPLRPLWPGLFANTAIYGGAWAVLIGGPILLRRWLRARRGGCPVCGYSREGLKDGAPCPECGAGV